MESSSPWSRLPFELAHEIAGHNADDVPALRALALVSKTMRSVAIKDLFSVVHFACAEDLPQWLDMLGRTPTLGNIVRKVKFSLDPNESWLKRHRGLERATSISRTAIPPTIPAMPNARIVEWDGNYGGDVTLRIAAAYMALFPNIQELHLKNMTLISMVTLTNFLCACGRLKVLSFSNTTIYCEDSDYDSEDSDVVRESPQPGSVNLAELDELVIKSTYIDNQPDFLLHLAEHSPPAKLKSLTFGSAVCTEQEGPCSVPAMDSLLQAAAPSLVHLVIEPTLQLSQTQISEMFGRLPPFPALHSLTIWLGQNRKAEMMIRALAAAPNLHTIIFRIEFFEDADDDDDREHLDRIMRDNFPWTTSESIKSFLKRKFPSIQRQRWMWPTIWS
ncbi:hypothetical protein B0H17DRAFT_323327 [Mycena rosella]|uniref:F-box domain-containing protein n=1 Tax=Mycena rosella TaxID=1033263 RepID=A0AAD7GPU1_MYCRO|nr:hypothetical protein B0H17DRAFT_323327 [Mycena rosella]